MPVTSFKGVWKRNVIEMIFVVLFRNMVNYIVVINTNLFVFTCIYYFYLCQDFISYVDENI
jgi:hypothetical protein